MEQEKRTIFFAVDGDGSRPPPINKDISYGSLPYLGHGTFLDLAPAPLPFSRKNNKDRMATLLSFLS